MSGISTATLARLSNGEGVTLEVINRICKVLDCQHGDILSYEPGEECAEPPLKPKRVGKPVGAGRKKTVL